MKKQMLKKYAGLKFLSREWGTIKIFCKKYGKSEELHFLHFCFNLPSQKTKLRHLLHDFNNLQYF